MVLVIVIKVVMVLVHQVLRQHREVVVAVVTGMKNHPVEGVMVDHLVLLINDVLVMVSVQLMTMGLVLVQKVKVKEEDVVLKVELYFRVQPEQKMVAVIVFHAEMMMDLKNRFPLIRLLYVFILVH
jgi:hypothetical protein